MSITLKKIWQFLKSSFLYGLVALAPIYVTVRVLVFVINYADKSMAPVLAAHLPVHIPGLGLITALVVILVVGFSARLVMFRQITRYFEGLIDSIPLVRTVYSGVKQVVAPLLGGDSHQAFKQVVMIEWPGNDLWVLGFLVKDDHTAPSPDDEVLIFLPTNHLHLGFVVATRRCRLRPVDMSIEEALKLEFSLGVAAPDRALISARTLGA
jgi:uncharacterized membrane protein